MSTEKLVDVVIAANRMKSFTMFWSTTKRHNISMPKFHLRATPHKLLLVKKVPFELHDKGHGCEHLEGNH
jgi:hypothetical protein